LPGLSGGQNVFGTVHDEPYVPRIGIVWAVVSVVTIDMICVPIIFRYSRVIWAHVNVATKP